MSYIINYVINNFNNFEYDKDAINLEDNYKKWVEKYFVRNVLVNQLLKIQSDEFIDNLYKVILLHIKNIRKNDSSRATILSKLTYYLFMIIDSKK